MSRILNRRDFLKYLTAGAGGIVLVSCGQAPTLTPEKVIETREVTKEVTKEVLKEVTPTAAPVVLENVADVLGTFPRRGTLIAAQLSGVTGTPDNFNEWVGWKWRDRGMQTLANEPLWSVDFATGEIINGSASGDPKYNSDFTTLEVPLRKGVTWSDGEPFTSADLVYTIETLIKYEGFNDGPFFKDNVASVSAPDDYTVKFELKQSNSRFHTRFLDRWGCTWIMPKHIFEKQADPVKFTFNPFVGTGPYKLHSFDPAGAWTAWEKRADWDKSPTGILYGEPQPKYIVYQGFTDEGSQILSQLLHECDATNLSSEGLKALLAQGKTTRAYQPNFPFVVNNDPTITGFNYNTQKTPFDNVDVRWALVLAIDIVQYMATAVDCTGTVSPVHIPSLGSYPKDYIKPMQDWLKAFTLDVGGGETFAPYDPDAPTRIAKFARGRGYVFPDDAAYIEKAFGIGWFKYAPDIAEKLLVKNKFSKNADGKWLLPNGAPWKIVIATSGGTSHYALNGLAASQAWMKFGIDAELWEPPNLDDVFYSGQGFDVATFWAAQEPWGAGPDLYRVLDKWNSEYLAPVGQRSGGMPSRWSSPAMDAIIKELRETDPADAKAVIAVGTKGLKEVFTSMPSVPTYGYTGFVGWDMNFWTNWPGSENPYTQPYTHWGPFKYMTPRLKSTGA